MTTVNGLVYSVLSDPPGARLEKAGSGIRELIVPNTVQLEGKELPVLKIARKGFANNETLERVVLSKNIREIENGAFLKSNNLKEIVFAPGGNLEIIGDGAFYSCKNLGPDINLPGTVRELRPWVFKDCPNIKKVTVPVDGALTMINDSAFEGCDIHGAFGVPTNVRFVMDRAFHSNKNLNAITFGTGNDSQLEWLAPGSLSETAIQTITIPAKTENIGEWTFMNTPSLRELKFAAGLDHHFKPEGCGYGCYILKGTNVEVLDIPKSTKQIKDFAFEDVETLREVHIPEDVEVDLIGPRAFAKTKVTKLNFGDALRDIEPGAFTDCKQLTEFTVPKESKLRRCKNQTFQNCDKLKILHLPGVEGFDNNVFDGCVSLRVVKFTLPGQSEQLRKRQMVLPENLFGDAKIFVSYPQGTLKATRENLKKRAADFE